MIYICVSYEMLIQQSGVVRQWGPMCSLSSFELSLKISAINERYKIFYKILFHSYNPCHESGVAYFQTVSKFVLEAQWESACYKQHEEAGFT